jgi:anti-sigma B factor antagonist
MNIQTEEVNGVLVAHLLDEVLDAGNVKEFKVKMNALITPGAKMVFDLSSLTFVDSSGVGALLSCLRQLNSTGGVFKLCAMVKPVRALFELVRMHRVFEIFNTQEEAVRSCGGSLSNAVTAGD